MNKIEIGILKQILEDLQYVEIASTLSDREADWRLGNALRLVHMMATSQEE